MLSQDVSPEGHFWISGQGLWQEPQISEFSSCWAGQSLPQAPRALQVQEHIPLPTEMHEQEERRAIWMQGVEISFQAQ